MNYKSSIDESASLSDNKRFNSALRLLEETLNTTKESLISLICTYNMAAIHWSCLGNGSRARELFLAAVQIARSGQVPTEDNTMKTLLANSCENLMLLSLSYEEYQDWSLQLRELQPQNDILRGHVPVILNAREQGRPWSDMLQAIALSYYNRGDSSKDPGRYGCGASTWELLLSNRKMLRVSRENWQSAVFEFGALTMRVIADALMKMENSPDAVDLSECMFIAEPSLKFANEYLTTNPDDKQIGKLKQDLEEFCGSAQVDLIKSTPSTENFSRVADGPTGRQARLNPIPAVLSIIVGTTLGGVFGGLPWMIAGAFGGLLFGLFLFKVNGVNRCSNSRQRTSVSPEETACCSLCGMHMKLINGMVRTSAIGNQIKFCCQCRACGRLTCYECSDNREPCKCGAHQWAEKMYEPAGRGSGGQRKI